MEEYKEIFTNFTKRLDEDLLNLEENSKKELIEINNINQGIKEIEGIYFQYHKYLIDLINECINISYEFTTILYDNNFGIKN